MRASFCLVVLIAAMFGEFKSVASVPADTLSVSVTTVEPTCFSEQNGAIELTVQGGTPPYAVLWSDGHCGTHVEGLAAGEYRYFLTDAHGKTTFGFVALGTPDPLQINDSENLRR